MKLSVRTCFFAIAALLLSASAVAFAQDKLDPVFTTYDTVKLAEGIYAFISPEAMGAFVSGNSVLIVGSDSALVVDSGHVPSLTRRMIIDITRLTNKPVRFLVNTHWHPDHVTGNSLYGTVEHDKQYMQLVTQALEALSQQAHAAVKQGLTQEQFLKSVDVAKFRTQMTGGNEVRGRNFDQYFVSSGAARAYREAKDGPLKYEN